MTRSRFFVFLCSLALMFVFTGCSLTRSQTSTSTSGAGTGSGAGIPVPVGPSGGGGGGTTSGGEFLYVVENYGGQGHVEGFHISSNTGALSGAFSEHLSNQQLDDITVDNASQYLLVGTSDQCCVGAAPQVESFFLDAQGHLNTRNFADLPNFDTLLNKVIFDRSGTMIYVSTRNEVSTNGDMSQVSMDRGTGTITTVSGFSPTYSPGWLLVHPNGLFVYAAVQGRHQAVTPGGFMVFHRDPATGLITDDRTSTTSTTTYPGPRFEELYSKADFALGALYLVAASPSNKVVTVFSVDGTTGALKGVSEIPGDFSTETAVDQTGNWVIETWSSGLVQSYRINSAGTLALASSANIAAGTSGTPVYPQFDPSNHYIYLTNGVTPQVYALTFNPDTGALGAVPGSPFAATSAPSRMATATK